MNLLIKRNIKKIRNNIRFYPHREKTVCLIATMPKSGTWLSQYFFWALKQYIKIENFHPEKCDFNKTKVGNFISFDNSSIFVGHATCPGYEYEVTDKYMEKWKALNFWNPGYNWVNHEINRKYFPKFNEKVKILYLYREPLSQVFSYFNYCKEHQDPLHKKHASVPLIDFYTKISAIDSYIKQYHTFEYMKNKYPNNIYLMKYEDLISNPIELFSKICEFFDINNSNHMLDKNIKLALDFTSIENLKKIEQKTKKSLANDGNRNSHIQGEKYGKYSDFLDSKDFELINENFEKLGYSLNDFKI